MNKINFKYYRIFQITFCEKIYLVEFHFIYLELDSEVGTFWSKFEPDLVKDVFKSMLRKLELRYFSKKIRTP